jgi:DNA-binding transcriptional MerR regulator
MPPVMKLIVNQLSKLAGVTVRTLHYYDEIGLLRPDSVGDNNYRYYGDTEVHKLQQIMFFRELEFSLEDIKKTINTPSFSTTEALKDQKELLKIKAEKIKKLMTTIDNTLNKKDDKDMFASFSDYEMNQYKEEAKERWGKTDAYKQSQERTKNWTKDDYKKISEDGKKFTQTLADSMDLPVNDPKVQALITQHHHGIEVFYDCPKAMYRELGKMYVADPRFTAYYDKFRPGLAQFVCDAIGVWCEDVK